MPYDHKGEQLYNTKGWVEEAFDNLHPTDRAKAFGELSEWASKRRDVREQINARDGVPERPTVDEVHVDQPLTKIHVPGGAKEKTPVDTGWDNPPGDMLEDLRKAKAMIKADLGLKPSYMMSAEAKKYFDQAVMAERDYAQQYWNDFGCDPDKKPSRFFEQLAAEKARLATRAHEAFVRDGNLNSPLSPERHCCDTKMGGIHTDECSEALKRALKHEPTTQEWLLPNGDVGTPQPLEVLSESVSWPAQGMKHSPTYVAPRITCYCKHPTGVLFKVDDRVRVEAHPDHWGTVTKVCADGNVQVLLDADEAPAISPKEAQARVAIPSGVPETHVARITCSADSVFISRSFSAYVKTPASDPLGAYIGCMVSENDDGTVTIEVRGVKPYDPNHPLPVDAQVVNVGSDAGVIDFLDQNRKEVRDKLIDDLVSPNGGLLAKSPLDDIEQCEECKGTGTWTSPFTNETSPCSRGCKS